MTNDEIRMTKECPNFKFRSDARMQHLSFVLGIPSSFIIFARAIEREKRAEIPLVRARRGQNENGRFTKFLFQTGCGNEIIHAIESNERAALIAKKLRAR